MKKYLFSSICLLLIFSCKKDALTTVASTKTPINVTVDANTINNDIANQYRGINITDNWEDQSYWNYPISTAATLNAIKPNIIRYGNDDYFWSEPPYTAPSPHLIDYGPNEFLSQQTDIIENDGIHFKSRILDIDEFVALCRATGSEPEIIIPYDRINYVPLVGDNVTTKEDFLKNAEEMVRYCNVFKGYHIKFWEIGNETFQPDHNITATQYGNDLVLFSQRMKAVDPSIKIMANGNSDTWFNTVLTIAANSIDYINTSEYPTYTYKNYDYYVNNDINYNGDSFLNKVIHALYNSGASGRIKLILTEFNAAGFGGPNPGSDWPDNNDLGHALVCFQLGADFMNNAFIYFSSFWNLRWYYGYQPTIPWQPIDKNPKTVFNAADNQGNLNPNGQSVSLLYNNIFGAMADAQSNNQLIRPYACFDKVSGNMNVFLVNKDHLSHTVKISLKNISKTTGQVSVFTGTSDTDTKPTLKKQNDVTLTGNTLTLTLSGVSITLIQLN